VTDTITIKKFPKLDRFGQQAGSFRPAYLGAEGPAEPPRSWFKGIVTNLLNPLKHRDRHGLDHQCLDRDDAEHAICSPPDAVQGKCVRL